MANLIKQKFLEGIDSSKFKIEQGGAIKAVNSSGQLVEVFKFDAVNEVVKVFGDEEVAVSSYVDSLMAQEVIDRNSAINQAITDLINGAPQALDTLKELADALGNDGDAIASLISQLAQEVTDRQADVDAEESRAMLVEQGLNTRLTQAESDIDSLESRMSTAESDIDAEESRAMLVEQGLNTRVTQAESDIDSLESRMSTAESDIDAEESRAMLVEQGLNTRLTQAESDIDSLEGRMSTAESDIDAEESRAMLVEQGLNTRLTQTESDIDSLEGRMSTAESDIDAEESRAMLVEQGLNTRLTQAESDIDSLEGRMSTAESDIDAEESARQQGDSATLASANSYTDSKISLVMNNLDTQALDSLSEIVTAFEAADSTLNGAITSLSQSASSGLAQEISDRQAADAAIISDLEDLDGYAQEIRSDLDQEILDRQTAVSAEESRATGVEASLQSQITQEVSDRQTAVSAEESRAMGVEASLQSQITQEVSDRQADVDAEEVRAIAAETQLQSNIDAVDNARVAKESELEAEDLTLLKLDGSRTMTGNLKMMSDVNGLSNGIDWNYVGGEGGTEIINSRLAFGSFMYNYSNSFYQNTNTNEQIYWGTGGIQLGMSKGNVYENESLTEQNYNRSAQYGIDAIQILSGQDEVLDQDGNVVLGGVANEIELNFNRLRIKNGLGELISGPVQFEMGYYGLPSHSIYMNAANGSATFSKGEYENGGFNRTIIEGNSMNTKAITLYDPETEAPFVPTDVAHAVNKAYVDSQISGNKTFEKESFEIDSVSELSYVDLTHTPVENSLVVFVNRLAVHEDVDYSVSVVDGVTRLTWIGDFAVGQVEEIESGDVIRVVYMR